MQSDDNQGMTKIIQNFPHMPLMQVHTLTSYENVLIELYLLKRHPHGIID